MVAEATSSALADVSDSDSEGSPFPRNLSTLSGSAPRSLPDSMDSAQDHMMTDANCLAAFSFQGSESTALTALYNPDVSMYAPIQQHGQYPGAFPGHPQPGHDGAQYHSRELDYRSFEHVRIHTELEPAERVRVHEWISHSNTPIAEVSDQIQSMTEGSGACFNQQLLEPSLKYAHQSVD